MVRVISHPGLAYRQLWKSTVDTLSWFVVGAGLVLLVGLMLLRWMLRPLQRVEWQAEAICNREFPVVEDKPFTYEFRRVVEAMNRLSSKVRQMLDNAERMASQLREQANTDALTGLANRRHFMSLLQARLEDADSAAGGKCCWCGSSTLRTITVHTVTRRATSCCVPSPTCCVRNPPGLPASPWRTCPGGFRAVVRRCLACPTG